MLRRVALTLLERLFIVNVIINGIGVVRSIRYQRKKADALRKPDLPAGSDPADVIVQQCIVIKALQHDCVKLRQLSEKQRLYILRKRPSQQDGCRSCRGSDVQVRAGSDQETKCPVCWHSSRDCALQCGHLMCERCSLIVTDCPLCRVPVQHRLKLYT